MIFAHADGSSGPDLFSKTSSSTATCWPLVSFVMTSLFNFAWPRTLTLLATTIAGPAVSGTVFNSAAGSFFLVTVFFLSAFLGSDFFSAFGAGLGAGAGVVAGAGA